MPDKKPNRRDELSEVHHNGRTVSILQIWRRNHPTPEFFIMRIGALTRGVSGPWPDADSAQDAAIAAAKAWAEELEPPQSDR